MKKILTLAMMAVAATTAFAQNNLVKEAKKLLGSGDYANAASTLAPALTSAETTDKAAAWNLMNDIKYKAYQNEFGKLQLHQPYDLETLVNSLIDGFNAAEECEKYDILPNEKGKVKIRFHKNNATRYANERQWLYNGGILGYQEKKPALAIKSWGKYVESNKSPLFHDMTLPADTLMADAAYNAALLSYQEKDMVGAQKYAAIAATFPEKADEAMEMKLFIQKESCKTAADSAAYLATLTQLHKAEPKKEKYFNMLQEYYTRSGNFELMKSWAKEETQIDPTNKMAWAILGESEMNTEKWDEAITAFKNAIEIDPNWVNCVFNIGVCLNNKATVLNDQLMDKKTMGLTKENAEKVKDVLREAKTYLEKSRELDPERKVAPWSYHLYRIYYSLGEKAKMEELEAIDPALKDM